MNPREEIAHLTEVLERANHQYYVLDAPEMEDYEYDRLLRRLEDKGAVSAVSEGGMKHYRPQVAREDAAVQETEHLLERVYQGSVSLLVSSLVKKQTLSQEEIDKLYAILREMEEDHD